MIDFKDCPKDENWLLFDSDGNCELMTDEIKLAYACYQIAKEKLEGYFLVNVNDFIHNSNGYEKYPIDNKGFIENYPHNLFTTISNLWAEVLRIRMGMSKID